MFNCKTLAEARKVRDRIIDDYRDIAEPAMACLDEGFESVYEKVKIALTTNKEAYRDEILKLQELIQVITDHSVSVTADEHRNRDLAVKEFAKQKSGIKTVKQSKHVANLYNTSMKKLGYVGAQFMDKKN
jgi:hypothetical protein